MSGDQLFIVALAAIIIPGVFSVVSTILAIIIGKRLETYKQEINSRMSELIESKEQAARGEGRVEGIASQKQETADIAAAAVPTQVEVVNVEPVDVQVVNPPEKEEA